MWWTNRLTTLSLESLLWLRINNVTLKTSYYHKSGNLIQIVNRLSMNPITIMVDIPMTGLPLELTFNLKFVTRRYEFWQSEPNITSFISYNSIQYRAGAGALESCLHIRIEFLGSLCRCWQRAYSTVAPTYITLLGIRCQRSMLKCGGKISVTSIFRF